MGFWGYKGELGKKGQIGFLGVIGRFGMKGDFGEFILFFVVGILFLMLRVNENEVVLL